MIGIRPYIERALKYAGSIGLAVAVTIAFLPADARGNIPKGGCGAANACNNDEGCGAWYSADANYYVIWFPMSRSGGESDTDANPFYQKCKDWYYQDTSGGGCAKGTFNKKVCENGCKDNQNACSL